MSALPATSPAWLRHLNGDLPNPTEKEIEADKQATEDALAYLHTHGKWDAESAQGIDDLNAYYSKNFPPTAAWQAKHGGNAGIDWQRLHAAIPWIAVVLAVVVWAMFLLIPTAFNLHYAGMFPAANNWLYVLMGMVLVLAGYTAAKVQHGARAILFTFAVLLLSYWF